MCRFQSSWAIDWRDCITGFHCKIESNVKTSDVFDVIFMVFMFFMFCQSQVSQIMLKTRTRSMAPDILLSYATGNVYTATFDVLDLTGARL